MAIKTEQTDEYYNLLIKLSKDEGVVQKCLQLIENFDQNELDYAVTATVWGWKSYQENLFYQLLETIFKRGGNPNAIVKGPDTPAIFYTAFLGEPKLFDIFIKWGADVTVKKIVIKPIGDVFTLSLIEYVIYNWLWESKPLQEKIIKRLVKAGSPTDLTELPKKFGNNTEKYFTYIEQVKAIIKNYQIKLFYKRKIKDMQEYIDKLENYVFELEHRPPELGGPEYEAGRQRWEGRKLIFSPENP